MTHLAPICGAKTRKGTPCQRQAGWGTVHLGRGRCKWHGGVAEGDGRLTAGGLYSKQLRANDKEEYERLVRSDPSEAARESLVRILIMAREAEERLRPVIDEGSAVDAVEALEKLGRFHVEISKLHERFIRATEGTKVKVVRQDDLEEFALRVAQELAQLVGEHEADQLLARLFPAADRPALPGRSRSEVVDAEIVEG